MDFPLTHSKDHRETKQLICQHLTLYSCKELRQLGEFCSWEKTSRVKCPRVWTSIEAFVPWNVDIWRWLMFLGVGSCLLNVRNCSKLQKGRWNSWSAVPTMEWKPLLKMAVLCYKEHKKKQQFRLFKLGRALRLINPCQNSTVEQRSLAKAAVSSAYVMLIVEIVSWL